MSSQQKFQSHGERDGFEHTVFKKAALVLAMTMGCAGAASAYVGDSFLEIPGISGHVPEGPFDGWIRSEAHYWPEVPIRVFVMDDDADASEVGFAGNRMTFGGPGAPKEGKDSSLVISLRKDNPDLDQLMTLCRDNTVLPEMAYAESSEASRPILEVAPRPDNLPEYWQYKLKDAAISDCPVVDEAPEQALVISFADIEWLNYAADGPKLNRVDLRSEDFPKVEPAPQSPGTKAFVVSWFGVAGYVDETQCPVMNKKPTEDDYYAFMTKEQADAKREEFGEMGVDYGRHMGFRGPSELSVVHLPGIIADPGFSEPVSSKAHGVNLDGWNGSGEPPAGMCPQTAYTSIDGREEGIDNQLFTVVGCFDGYRGKHGYRNQTSNARRADGNITTLIEISGIDDAQNDDDIDVKIIHSMDHPMKDSSGNYLPFSTFRPSTEPQFAYFNRQFKGRIVDGLIVTDPIPYFELNTGLQDPLLILKEVQLRLEIQPDETLTGALGGYMDWKRFMSGNRSSYSENLFGFQAPGLYNALRRNADGLKDPVTGECSGISAAYEIEAVPAFISSDS